jgi:hypothetical protein
MRIEVWTSLRFRGVTWCLLDGGGRRHPALGAIAELIGHLAGTKARDQVRIQPSSMSRLLSAAALRRLAMQVT